MGAFVVSSAAELDTDVGDVFCGIRCDGGAPMRPGAYPQLLERKQLALLLRGVQDGLCLCGQGLARSIADLPRCPCRRVGARVDEALASSLLAIRDGAVQRRPACCFFAESTGERGA